MFRMLVVAVTAILATTPASAQPSRAGQTPEEEARARYNIFVMEGVLERAVEQGADNLRRQVRRVMPDMLLLSGGARARGFRLDGYGVFFDVEVPALRRSVAWSLRTMIEQSGGGTAVALKQLKAQIESIADPRVKASMQQTLKRLEMQVGPLAAPPAAPQVASGTPARAGMGVEAAVAPTSPDAVNSAEPAPAPAAEPDPAEQLVLEDPNEAYTRAVKTQLVDAMLDYSGPIGVGPDEWLTVAARDNEHRDRLMPGDLYDVATLMFRIKGSDLAAFRAERITRDEARARVEVREH